jgi:Flp pilus assembly CpaF family ATPase
LKRVELLVRLETQAPMQDFIADTIGLIVCIRRDGDGQRRVNQVVRVQGWDGRSYIVNREDQ